LCERRDASERKDERPQPSDQHAAENSKYPDSMTFVVRQACPELVEGLATNGEYSDSMMFVVRQAHHERLSRLHATIRSP
jgi:hypothetical protein